ncbi:MAG: hypothetical protein AB7P40_11580 [Chloroflexota bacterium]
MDQPDSPLSERSIIVLRQIAQGRSYDQILLNYPELTYRDIFLAAREALARLEALERQASSLEHQAARLPRGGPLSETCGPDSEAGVRRQPRPGGPRIGADQASGHDWTPDEDAQLERLYRRGAHPAEIAQALGRHNSAITGRLLTLGVVSETECAELSGLPFSQQPGSGVPSEDARPIPRSGTSWEHIRRRLPPPPDGR